MPRYLGVAAIVYLLVMTFAAQYREFPHRRAHLEESSRHGLFQVPADAIRQVVLKSGDRVSQFSRLNDVWHLNDRIIQAHDHNRLLNEFCQMLTAAEPVRTFQPEDLLAVDDPDYGFSTSRASLQATSSDGNQIMLEFGYPTPDGGLSYVRKRGDPALYVMSGFLFEQFEQLIKVQNLPVDDEG